MVVVPCETELTTPEEGLTVATAVLLLVHVPPVLVLAKVIVLPKQTVFEPVIGAVAATNAAQVPVFVEPDAIQLEVEPLRPNPFNAPSLVLPLISVSEVIPELFELTAPSLNR